jgi:4-nitrophenyl phosphatase
VLVGWFPEFTMPALEAACHAVWGGAVLFSASQTPFFATANGRALGTSRAISAMIRSLTGSPLLEVPMAHRGRALAIAVGTGLGSADAYDHLPAERKPHLRLRGVDELLALVTDLSSAGGT